MSALSLLRRRRFRCPIRPSKSVFLLSQRVYFVPFRKDIIDWGCGLVFMVALSYDAVYRVIVATNIWTPDREGSLCWSLSPYSTPSRISLARNPSARLPPFQLYLCAHVFFRIPLRHLFLLLSMHGCLWTLFYSITLAVPVYLFLVLHARSLTNALSLIHAHIFSNPFVSLLRYPHCDDPSFVGKTGE